MNRLEAIVPNARIVDKEKRRSKFDYRMLMRDSNVIESEELIKTYDDLYKKYAYSFSSDQRTDANTALRTTALTALSDAAGSASLACDMLVHYLFATRDSGMQKMFWLCFADMVLDNLRCNMDDKVQCEKCGEWVWGDKIEGHVCNSFEKIKQKSIVCCDCGQSFLVFAHNNSRKRCDECSDKQKIIRNKTSRKKYKK